MKFYKTLSTLTFNLVCIIAVYVLSGVIAHYIDIANPLFFISATWRAEVIAFLMITYYIGGLTTCYFMPTVGKKEHDIF